MNYLAHVYLAEDSDDALVGNLLGDFVRGKVQDHDWPPAIARGIRLHRRVDSFTDTHPIVQRSKARLPAERRRVAGIVVDVAYDHFLALHWEHFSATPLPSFTQRVYRALEKHSTLWPARLAQMAPYMINDDWLYRYRRPDVAARVLDGIARRLRRPEALLGSGVEMLDAYEGLRTDFFAFFPDLVDYAHRCREELAGTPTTNAASPHRRAS